MKQTLATTVIVLLVGIPRSVNAQSLTLTSLEATGDCGGTFYLGKVLSSREVFHYSIEAESRAFVGLSGRAVPVGRISFSEKGRTLRFVYQAGSTKVTFTGLGKNRRAPRTAEPSGFGLRYFNVCEGFLL